MAKSAKARILAIYDGNYSQAFKELEEAISMFPNNDYPLLTKADLAVHSRNVDILEDVIAALEKRVTVRTPSYRSFLKYKAYLISMKENADSAKRFIQSELSGLGNRALVKLSKRIEEIAKT